jgi:hypothetical protein
MNQKGVTSLFSGIAILFVSIIFLGIFIYFAMNYFGTLEDSQRMKNNRDNLAYINDILTDLKDSEVGSYKEVYLDLSDPITVDNNSSNLYLRQEIKNKRSIENLKTQSQIGSLIINRQETSLLYNIDYNNNILFYNYIDIMPGLEELRFSVVDKNNNIPIIEIQRIGDEILIEEVVNQSIVLSNNNINQDLVLTSYFIASDAVDTEYLNKTIFFEEPITIEKKETKEIYVVCAPEENYILKLNTDKGREIVKPIKTNNYNVLDCIDYQIIGYWKIDEGEGSTIYDYSGNSNNGSIVGTANWNSSSKLNLDGTNDYINVENVGDYSSFTINGWIYYTENQSLEHESFFWSQKNNLRVSINPVDKKMEIRWRDLDGSYSTYELSDPVLENKWINYTVTYDDTSKTLKGYINGDLEKTVDEIYSYETQGGGVKFGINSTNTRYFKGMISDYRLYGRSLNLNEIKAIYDNTKNEYVEELTININSPTQSQTFSFGEAIDFNSQIENENGSYSCSWVSSIDGSLSSNCDFSTSSLTVGEHTITLSVTDLTKTETSNVSITITENPLTNIAILSPLNSSEYTSGDNINFSAEITEPVGEYSCSWTSSIDGDINSYVSATGGDITDIYIDGWYRIHAFKNTGENTFVVENPGRIDALIVGGGGSGGVGLETSSCVPGSGGGAGGLIFLEDLDTTIKTYNLIVGNGGASQNTPSAPGNNGENSSFNNCTALGGGGGGSRNMDTVNGVKGQDGGSGGGGNHATYAIAGIGLQPTTTCGGYGNDGGNGYVIGGSAGCHSDGGGGAGEPGDLGFQDVIANGGDGLYFGNYFSDNYGENGWFSGGGGMGLNHSNQFGLGGIGGGGSSNSTRTTPISGLTNSGGGGAGGANGGNGFTASGAGGSGIILIRYKIPYENFSMENFNNCDFNTSTLSVGEHTITLSVTDQENTYTENIDLNILPIPMSINIQSPNTLSIHEFGNTIDFNSEIINPVGSYNCSWTSSIDGSLSSDCNFSSSNLSIGEHTITLSVTDQNQTLQDTITIEIENKYLEATGGTVTTSGDYKYHTFTSSGTFNVTTLGEGKVDVLVVGGGGGAGKAGTNTLRNPGGGGAGGLVYVEDYTLSSTGNITVTVGAGGTGSTNQNLTGNNGNNSVFKNLIAYGGGGGGSRDNPSRDGTSGGSGGGANLYSAVPANGGSATQPSTNDGYPNTGFGYPGATSVVNVGAGGGGGAGGPGTVPNGGPGMTIWGNTYAKGGDAHSDASSAAANTGNGGNGSATNSSANGGNGGSGIVIVRYKFQN